MDGAVATIASAGERGSTRLKQEIEVLSKSQKHDLFFETLAGWLLLDISKMGMRKRW